MFKINDNFLAINQNYLFSEVARKIGEFTAANPGVEVIRMGIGDVTRPLPDAVIEALHRGVDRQAKAESFNGYGPEQGYASLRQAIAKYDYAERGVDISADEIFISDGAKCDTGNILDILGRDNKVALTDPVYPVYLDTNIMAGRREGVDIQLLPCTPANNFTPPLPDGHVDIIYLCSPNNPTGTALSRNVLKQWVDYARQNGSLILFDSAYEAYVVDNENIPRSIYEIEGAKEVAIEFRSFSKTAGFTGLRCGYTVVPKALKGADSEGNPVALNKMWNRRQSTKFNGASILSQIAAEAIYTPEGRSQIKATIDYYHGNAAILREALIEAGLKVYGGVNSPYLWVGAPGRLDSWQFFNLLLAKCHVASTPGVGFGAAGEGFIRLTAFNTRPLTAEAARRIAALK